MSSSIVSSERFDRMNYKILQADVTKVISYQTLGSQVDLTFLDPPFNQN